MKAGSKLLDMLDGTLSKNGPNVVSHPYSNAIHRLREYFGSRDYGLFQRQKLRSMPQGTDEPDLQYVRRVAAVAKLCGYVNDQLVETVADVIQHNANNRKVRDVARKAARKGSSLQELVDWVRSTEIEKQAEEIFSKNHPKEDMASVMAVSYADPRFLRRSTSDFRGRGHFPRNRGGFHRANGPSFYTTKPCWCCTSTGHRPDSCFAIEKFCHRCQTKTYMGGMLQIAILSVAVCWT